MTRKRKLIILVLGACVAAGGIVFTALPHRSKVEELYQISYIHRGEIPEDTQQVILQGMEQAAASFNVELTVVSMGHLADAKEQKTLLKKEVDNGANAVLIESVNSDGVRKEIEKINSQIPVIEVNAWTRKEKKNEISKVHADDYAMGQKLGKEILAQSELPKAVILIKSGTEYADVAQRYQGTKDILEVSGITSEEVEVGVDEGARLTAFAEVMRKSGTQHIVAFDSSVLEQLGKVK